METFLFRQVIRDAIVAGEAEGSLCLLGKGLMAGHAILFELRVRGDKRSGHHHSLPVNGR